MKLFYSTRKCNSYLLGLIVAYVNVLLLLQLLAEKGSFQAMARVLTNTKVCFAGSYTCAATPAVCGPG